MTTSQAISLIEAAEQELAPYWATLEQRCYTNFERVLDGFLAHDLSEAHFTSVTGYGHNDLGREATDAIFAHAFQAEAALVRLQLVSGTHAIAVALQGTLADSQRKVLVAVTGPPYDTLEEVIGIRGNSPMSLTARGADYHQINLLDTGQLRDTLTEPETEHLARAGVVFIQRSRGYSLQRPSLTISDLEKLIGLVRRINPNANIVVDNCYGEFVDTREPTTLGADLIAGSLIKNPGGGIVPTGGYVAGRAPLVAAAADALTAPGIGAEDRKSVV